MTSVAHAVAGFTHANASTSSLADSLSSLQGSSSGSHVSSSLGTEDTAIPDLESFPPSGVPKHEKLSGYEFYRSIGSPRKIVAPMVEGSELAWRVLSRRLGADLCYSPMINSKMYAGTAKGKARPAFRENNFSKKHAEEGASAITRTGNAKDTDRPLIVQFCGNEPALLLESALDVQDHCDAVDLNLGCPQNIAKRGHYGAFLQEDWSLIFSLINTLHLELKVPVTAKMRVFPSVERTVAYARMLERAGAQFIAVHGRTREMKGHKTGLADWKKIAAVKQAVKVPVFANGNVLYPKDVEDVLRVTGADGVMSAEGNLYNPAIFEEKSFSSEMEDSADAGPSRPPIVKPVAQFPFIPDLCDEYLDIIVALKTPASPPACKSHMFKLARPALEVHPDLRRVFGQAKLIPSAEGEERVKEYRAAIHTLRERLEADMQKEEYLRPPEVPRKHSASLLDAASDADVKHASLNDASDPDRPAYIPHWLAQPYFRPPMPPEELEKQAKLKEAKQKNKDKNPSHGRLIEIKDVQARADEAENQDEDELVNEAGLSTSKRKQEGEGEEGESADKKKLKVGA
ncbi:Dus-domain-containing protein [Tilletiaria anomala UBC 951]|uniref:tRNA-dihydrouridine(16/17) synthase [NAD(P)(+)] n=1 Tax=Tilletiaria anomala (strain ATCC 24038 / CBS 436.72 / UBC 951) TaxID=1037660 RepID=A0A066WI81_TILAU|nr:Dus-domain-containing protein [Tilletiaria anomala UBC 951]KDN52238.1 Dus-domain-containing protein [Tilletiaria anomala UBC 951]